MVRSGIEPKSFAANAALLWPIELPDRGQTLSMDKVCLDAANAHSLHPTKQPIPYRDELTMSMYTPHRNAPEGFEPSYSGAATPVPYLAWPRRKKHICWDKSKLLSHPMLDSFGLKSRLCRGRKKEMPQQKRTEGFEPPTSRLQLSIAQPLSLVRVTKYKWMGTN